jgi:hypothetical protein
LGIFLFFSGYAQAQDNGLNRGKEASWVCQNNKVSNLRTEDQSSHIDPIPVNGIGTLNFPSTSSGKYTFRVLSISGQGLSRQSGMAHSGMNRVGVWLPEVPAGTYFYRVTTPDGWVEQGKIRVLK